MGERRSRAVISINARRTLRISGWCISHSWAEPCDGQVRRVFEIDITTCPDCGGRLRWIAGGRLRRAAFGYH
jgi:hypothetical protein